METCLELDWSLTWFKFKTLRPSTPYGGVQLLASDWLPKHTMHHLLAYVQRRPLHAQHGVDDGAYVLLKMTGPKCG